MLRVARHRQRRVGPVQLGDERRREGRRLEGARGAGGYSALGGGGGGGGGGEETMPASRAFAVTLNQASLASLVASLRKVKESLSAL